MSRKVRVIAPCTDFRRWGTIAYYTVKELVNRGYQVILDPLYWDFSSITESEIALELNRYRLSTVSNKESIRLLLCPIGSRWFNNLIQDTILISHWDGSMVSPDIVSVLNKARAIIVPSEYNLIALSGSDMTAPLYQVPFGIEPAFFAQYTFNRQTDKFIFLTCYSGSIRSSRKNIDLIIEAFQKAFPENNKNTELWIKMAGGVEPILVSDDRIKVSTISVPWKKLSILHNKVNCYVSASSCEGWDMNALDSMAHGNPVIAPRFGGYRDYFDSYVGYEIEYGYERVKSNWFLGSNYHNLQARVSPGSLIDKMKEARWDAQKKRELSFNRACKYTWDNYGDNLEKVILNKKLWR